MKLRHTLLAFLAIAALALLVQTQAEAQTYPNRPIRIISPFPAGGGNDVLARIIGPSFPIA